MKYKLKRGMLKALKALNKVSRKFRFSPNHPSALISIWGFFVLGEIL
ncbi:hypothetical protein GCM10007183_20020 [Staphylococcus muscae]|uniref:Uncharacterized protein n=1 Tax=Staphylococcus muscae TaxID=1294 RepID=A0ABQ1HZ05_9STAP|nr:hypothetical protein GCM10007183_20020 [Staphylococcus muscae]